MEKKVFCFGSNDVITVKVVVRKIRWDVYEVTVNDIPTRVNVKGKLYEVLREILEEIFPELKDDIDSTSKSIIFRGYIVKDIDFKYISDYKDSNEILQDILRNTEIAVINIKELLDEINRDVAEAEIIMCR